MPPLAVLGSSPPEKVAVLRALRLGDLLCSVPALRALKTALPDAAVTLIGLPWAAAFVQRFAHYLDAFLEFPGYPGIPERPIDPSRTAEFFSLTSASGFDLALQMQGSGVASNAFTLLLGAKRSAGFFLPALYRPDDETFLAYPASEPEVRRHLKLMTFLGVPSRGEELEWPITDADKQGLEDLDEMLRLDERGYACVHAGAHEPFRRWSAQNFAQVADWLASRGLQVVLTGSRDEAGVVGAVSDLMTQPHLNLAGRTTIGELGALLSGARVLVSNDTAPSHIAAALKVPSVVVFTGSDPARWAPLDARLHRAVGKGNRQSHPCSDRLDQADLCLGDACALAAGAQTRTPSPSVSDVVEELRSLLGEETPGAA